MNPLKKPRYPSFNKTEVIPWGSVDKSFNTFITSYFKNNKTKQTVVPKQFKDCNKNIKEWISAHSLLGNPKADTFSVGLVLPVVNPITNKLNMGAISSAKVYVNRVKGINDKTIKDTRKILDELHNKYFTEADVAKESLLHILDVIDQFESKKEILTLIKKDPYIELLLEGLDESNSIIKLKSLL